MPNISPSKRVSEYVLLSLTSTIHFHIFLAFSSSHIKNSRENEDGRKIKKEMPDVIWTIYILAESADPTKRQAANAERALDP